METADIPHEKHYSGAKMKARKSYAAALGVCSLILAGWSFQHFLADASDSSSRKEFMLTAKDKPRRDKLRNADRPAVGGDLISKVFSGERRKITNSTQNNAARLKSYESSYESLSGLEGDERWTKFTNLLVEASITLSLEDFETLCDGFLNIDDRQSGLLCLGKRYAEEDPLGGLKWLGNLPDDGTSTQAFIQFAAHLPHEFANEIINFAKSHDNPARAAALLMSFGSGNTDLSLALEIVEAGNQNTALAAAWHDDIGLLMRGFVLEKNFTDAIKIAAHIKDSQLRTDAYMQVVRSIADRSPSEAAGIIKKLPDEAEQVRAIPFVADSLARLAPDKAAEWVSSLPSGVVRDTATKSVSTTLLSLYPEFSLDWAMNITSRELRDQQISAILDYAKAKFPSKYNQLKMRASTSAD